MGKYLSGKTNPFGSTTNIIIILLVIVSFIIPTVGSGIIQVNWGINQIHYLPQPLFYIWLALSAAAIVLMFLSPGQHFLSSLLAKYLWGESKLVGRIIFLIFVLAIFVIFRLDAHLYGNGYIKVSNFAQKTKPIFEWFEYGSTVIPYLFFLIIHSFVSGIVNAAIWSYQIVAFLSGAIFTIFSLKISEVITDDDDDRLGVFLLILFSGLTLFFFGMVENTPILLMFISFSVYAIIKLNRQGKKKYLYYLWGTALIGLLLDIQFITVLPLLFYLSFKHLPRRKKIGSFLGSLGALVIILSAIAIVYLKAIDNIALQNVILFFKGKSPEIDYSLFSAKHLIDIFNLFYLFIPIFVIYLFSIIRGFNKLGNDEDFRALGLLTIAQIIYMVVIDPKNGMAREIGMYGFLLTGFIFVGVYSLLKAKQYFALSHNIYMALSPIAFLLIAPAFFVHISPTATRKYLDEYLEYNETKYESALYAFRDYYIVKKDFEEAVLREKAITAKAPGALESKLIDDLYFHGRVDEAFEYALRLVERFPYKAVYHMQKGNLLKHYKKPIDAEKELKTAIKLDPYRIEFYHFLAELYREIKQEKKCRDILEKASSIDPKSTMILIDLTNYYYRAGRHKTTDSLADLVISLDPDEPYSYMFKGLVAEGAGRDRQALDYYEKFIKMRESLPEVTLIRKRINNLVLKMRNSTSID